MFASRQFYKDEGNDFMQVLVKKIMNSLYGVQISKDIDEFSKCKSEHWMQTEYDEKVLDFWRLPEANYKVQLKKDNDLDGDKDVKITLPSRLGAFILSF